WRRKKVDCWICVIAYHVNGSNFCASLQADQNILKSYTKTSNPVAAEQAMCPLQLSLAPHTCSQLLTVAPSVADKPSFNLSPRPALKRRCLNGYSVGWSATCEAEMFARRSR